VPFAFATQNQIHQKLVQGYADMTLMMPRWASCIYCSRFNPSLRASTRRGDGLQPIRRLLMYTDRLMKFAAKQTAILVAVLLSVPVAGGIVILLLHNLTEFLCSQMDSTLILVTVATTIALIIRQFRQTGGSS
jgi:hypothetical protein